MHEMSEKMRNKKQEGNRIEEQIAELKAQKKKNDQDIDAGIEVFQQKQKACEEVQSCLAKVYSASAAAKEPSDSESSQSSSLKNPSPSSSIAILPVSGVVFVESLLHANK